MSTTTAELTTLDCEGYRKLRAAAEADQQKHSRPHDYFGKVNWAVDRAKHYAEKTGLTAEEILDSWESTRDYWYMNFYQECNFPVIKEDSVRVFGTVSDLLESIGGPAFRCPNCEGVTTNPYTCNTGISKKGHVCDWKVYGLFGHLGKGISVFVKEKVAIEKIFMPIAWETPAATAE